MKRADVSLDNVDHIAGVAGLLTAASSVKAGATSIYSKDA